ncbi:MAG: hypothetical protein Q8O55_01615 [Dehalococcoidales bacterium]|nr:hypothetical protein [Dehalococcoidales bacterium]
MPREELRVSIIIKEDRIFLGAAASDCDPKMATLQGNLQTALERIPSFVEEANLQWDAAPHNPKSTIPEPVAKAPTRTATTAAKKQGAAKAVPAQPKMF